MATWKKLFLFGDQTFDIRPSLQELLAHRRKSRFLDIYLDKVGKNLMQEIGKLPSVEKLWFPAYLNIDALAEQLSEVDSQCTAVQTFLTTVIQSGNLILLFEIEPALLNSRSDVGIVGICTGALSGAAASLSESLQDLIEISVVVTTVALRLGLAMQRKAESIEFGTDFWAFTTSHPGEDELESAIDSYNKARPSHKRIFISSRSKHTFTISGPPSSLGPFRELALFRNTTTTALPIKAPFHAPHLIGPPIEELLDGMNTSVQQLYAQPNLISTWSGTPFESKTMKGLLTEVINEIMYKPLSWPHLLKGLLTVLPKYGATIRSVGPTNSVGFILRELDLQGVSACTAPKISQDTQSSQARMECGDIAIVGMAGRFPGADNLEDFWKILEGGLDLHREIPDDRFDVKLHFDPTGDLNNSSLTPFGVFIEEPGAFDVRMFNMSPREAAQTDPMQRLLLMTTYEALEMAGYSPGRTPSTESSRVGSFFGQTSDDWREVNASQNIDTFFITGGIRAFGPGRINYHFKWEGPSYSIDTACSSSAASIQLACSALLAREIDTAVAGGANILTASDLFAGLSRGGFLSKTGSCKTFDDAADGYCRGDAVGTVVLKRLEDSMLENDNILAVIKSVATNHSARAVSITHPHSETQQALFRQVLRNSNLSPNDINAVELHGTGTQAGDFAEFSSVLGVFGSHRPLNQPVYIGTVKPNLGHGEAASGVTSLMKSVLMLRHNIIPPHVGIKSRINHRLPPLDSVPLRLAIGGSVAWPKFIDSKRRILLNNFDAAGGNTSMIIEDPPAQNSKGSDNRSHHVVAISGRTPYSFERNRSRLVEFLKTHDVNLADVAYTTTARRQHHLYRRAYSVRSIPDLISLLEKDQATSTPQRVLKPKVCLLFTGQGSHYAGMGKFLFDTHTFCRRLYVEYDLICTQLGFESFLGLITGKLQVEAASPCQVQLALLSYELVALRLWKSWGLEPDAVLGHSLGEYAALVAAEILSPWDALYLVGTRAHMMQKICTPGTHSMLAVKLSAGDARVVLERLGLFSCEIACLNGPQATVISGKKEDIKVLQSSLDSEGTKTTFLDVPFAFHSSQMDAIIGDFGDVTRSVSYSMSKLTLASSMTGAVIDKNGIIDTGYLVEQCRKPVNFLDAVHAVQSKYTDSMIWVEIGPKSHCLGMVKSTLNVPQSKLIATTNGKPEGWAALSSTLSHLYNAGYDINWNEVHREHEHNLQLIHLPSYSFDLKSYWIQYEGNWSITKSQIQHTPLKEKVFRTSTLHCVTSETIVDDGITVVFETNMLDPTLRPAIDGHQVNRVGLCPSSLYGDMALSAAAYLFSRISSGHDTSAMDVVEMAVTKPFVADISRKEQYLNVIACKKPDTDIIHIKYTSVSGGKTINHATCTVVYGNGEQWLEDWQRQKYLLDSRIEKLILAEDSGTHKIHRGMVYKLFASLVTYSERYQGLIKVHLNSDALEAVGDVEFPPTPCHDEYYFNPYWIDILLHLSGFVLNGSDTTAEDSVYISHGWKSLRLPTKLQEGKVYQTYVRMQELGSTQVMAGDVYIFDDHSVVGLCTGLKFQRIRKSTLNHLLPNGTPSPAPIDLRTWHSKAKSYVHTQPSSVHREASQNELITKVLSMIAQEAGVAMSDLEDNVEFVEIGIDSLLSLSITARLREVTGIQLPPSVFLSCPTVRDLRLFVQEKVADSSSTDSTSDESGSELLDVRNTSSADTSTDSLVLVEEDGLSPSFLKKVISDELGIAESEVESKTEFADLGLDSLMSLVILNRVQTLKGQSLGSDFFLQHPTFGDVQRAYGTTPGHFKAGNMSNIRRLKAVPKPGISPTTPSDPRKTLGVTRAVSTVPSNSVGKECSSMLIQGSVDSTARLFLFPDGSGSSVKYTDLAPIIASVAVYGLNSPYLGNDVPFSDSIESIASLYVTEMRRIQPNGPYILGGWSIGGVHAYEAARQLVRAGQEVLAIIMIDTPCPKSLPPMSETTIDLLTREGAFGNKGPIPPTVQQHFTGSIRSLRGYSPQQMPPKGLEIPCVAIWAREGVFQSDLHRNSLEDITPDAVDKWLLFPRTDHRSTGWDELLPNYTSFVVDGNHFTMMKKPQISNVSDIIRDTLRSLLCNIMKRVYT